MRLLITGANGFIGSKLLSYYMSKGYEVIGWDIGINKYPIINVNMKDKTIIKKQLKEFNPNIILHCAGSADVNKSILDPNMDFQGNVELTHNLLFSIYELKMFETKFVYLSSAAVYGNPVNLPISENTQLNPLSPYALHKVLCENVCMYFAHTYGMNIKIARIFSAYGEGLRKQIFWDMHTKITQTGKLELYGTGNESRDFIHINDLVQAIYLIADTSSRDIIYNVANGQEITIRKTAEDFVKCNGMTNKIITFNGISKEGNPLNWCADISKLKKLGYVRKISLIQGIELYIKWLDEISHHNKECNI